MNQPTTSGSAAPPTMAPPGAPSGTSGLYYADVPNRAIAYIIDAIILAIIGIIVGILLSAILGPTQNVVNDPAEPFGFRVETNFVSALVSALVSVAISAAYFIYTWTKWRATPGQRVLGMQVGNAS